MTNNRFLKGVVITSFAILIGIYVSYRSGFFEPKDEENQIEIETDGDSFLIIDTVDHKGVDVIPDSTSVGILPDSTLNELLYMSSSKVIRVINKGDVVAEIEKYKDSRQKGLKAKQNRLKRMIKELSTERNRLAKSSGSVNPIIQNLDNEIKRLTDSLKVLEPIKLNLGE